MPAVLGILLLLSGGAAFAAEGALPGEALYPVKVGVNEEVRGWLAFSPEAKAHLGSDLVAERLEEAEELFAEGNLQGDISAKLSERFDAHAEEAQKRIADLEASGEAEAAAEARARLEAVLSAHESILTDIAEADSFAEIIAARVRARVGTVMRSRTDAEARIDANVDIDREAIANRAHGAAETAIDEAEEALVRAEGEIDANLYARVEARLGTAQETYAKGETELRAENYGQAFVLFNRARLIAHEVTHFLNAHFRVDVRLGDIRSDREHRVDVRDGASDGVSDRADTGKDSSVDSRDTDSTNSNSRVDIETDTRVDVDASDDAVEVDGEIEVDAGVRL